MKLSALALLALPAVSAFSPAATGREFLLVSGGGMVLAVNNQRLLLAADITNIG